MSSTGVRVLNQSLFRLTHITHLYLNQNSLAFIPPEVADLQALVILDLSNNLIQ